MMIKILFICLGSKANDGYHNTTTDFRSYFISFDDGAGVEINKLRFVEKRKTFEGRLHE